MTGTSLAIFCVGIVAQILFAGRTLIQWILSEKARRSVSPAVFWQLSLAGSILFFAYGVLRRDLAIVLGQLVVYFVYVRNLHLGNRWASVPATLRWAVYLVPAASLAYLVSGAPGNAVELLGNPDVPPWLMAWGALGQAVFTSRFILQWIYSERRKQSVFPRAFWIVSLAGSAMIMSYAVLRHDPVLLVGQLCGAVAYARNLSLRALS